MKTSIKKTGKTHDVTPKAAVVPQSAEELKDILTAKYGLSPAMWWKKEEKDRETKRVIGTNWILHQTGFEAIAVIEGLVFSEPVVHEQPGRIITRNPDGSIFSILDLPQTPGGKLGNFGRYCLSGTATSPDGKVVSAYASASDGGSGDACPYGSAYVGAMNRLRARLVKNFVGGQMVNIYSSEDDVSFARPDHAVAAEPALHASAIQAAPVAAPVKPHVAEPALHASANTPASAQPEDGDDDIPFPALPKAEPPKMQLANQEAPKPVQQDKPVATKLVLPNQQAVTTKPVEAPKKPEAAETKPAPVQVAPAPAAPAAAKGSRGDQEIHRMAAEVAKNPSENEKLAKIESELARAFSQPHLQGIWKGVQPIVLSLSKEGQEKATELKTKRRRYLLENDLIRLNASSKDPKAAGFTAKTPSQVADSIIEDILESRSAEDLGKKWEINKIIYSQLSGEPRDRVFIVKCELKEKFGLPNRPEDQAAYDSLRKNK